MRIAMIGQKGFEIGESGGGIEQHVQMLSKHLVLRGNAVTIYARERYAHTKKHPPKGITIKPVKTIYRKNLEAILYTFLATMDAVRQPFEIIHYHGVGPATLAWIPRLFKPRTKVVVTFHSQDRFHKKWSLFARLYLHFGEWAACWFPNATISVSHVIQVYCRYKYRRQIVFIPNGAPVQHVRSRRALSTFGVKPNKYLLNVSRLVRHKGQHYLIQAFQNMKAHLGKKANGWKLVLVGAPAYTGDYEKELKQMASGDEDVVFAGYQTGLPLKELYANAYLYVHPSESEGLAVVVIEAMSFGTPVLVSDIPENLEVMHHAGFSYKNGSIRDLTEKLVTLVSSPDRIEASAQHVQDVVEKEFNWEQIAKRTEALYRSVRH